MIVLVSDNGASGEGGPNGSVNENKIFNGLPDTIEENLQYLDDLGSPQTYNHYPTGWAWAFNTPFKLWKRYANYEGGTADPMIVSWPARITADRRAPPVHARHRHRPDASTSASASSRRRWSRATPSTRSRASASRRPSTTRTPTTGKQTQFYSMLGTRAIWHEGWKAAAVSPAAPDAWGDFADQRWELFDTETDPSECHDLAEQHPEKLQELIALWWTEAGQYGALPLESRDVVEILAHRRPQLAKPRDRYVYYPGCAEVPESVAPNIRNRSYTIAVEVDDRHRRRPSGVLFAQGARFGGHALYVKDGKLKYVYNWVGCSEQIVESTEPLPTGMPSSRPRSRGKATRCRPRARSPSTSATRRSAQAGSRPSRASSPSPAKASTSARTAANPSPTTTPARLPWPFVGGTIQRAVIDVSGEPFVDLAEEAGMAFARD